MQQGGGGSQYGAPPTEMPPFSISGAEHAEAASPISSRPPNFDELAPAVPGPAAFQDDDVVGEEADRGGVPGNRWPRQETLALLKIRSDMDSAFRDATLKGPLWEEVSRKLAELGYIRSAKKCKEKFENVHKYYKRTKEGRAGRQDGKSYRFFSQLEALHSSGGAASAANPNPNPSPNPNLNPTPPTARIHTTTPIPAPPITTAAPASGVAGIAGISFSSNTWSSESDDEDTEEMVTGEGRKRKYSSVGEGGSSGSGTSRKMMAFFEGLMKQVMERQEAMQQKFLETIEKREQDRMIREEAWKRQEMARLNREHELLAQDRAMAASRDAAVFSFLQKITGQTITIPTTTTAAAATAATTTTQQQSTPPPPPPVPVPIPTPTPTPAPAPTPAAAAAASLQAMKTPQQQNNMEIVRHQGPSSTELGIVPVQEISPSHEAVASSRWPKTEVHALIRLRSGLETRYQEAGPKGPLWEEISSEMMKLGYNRSSKRCKEKWENINKYFKKVKESNKKRPEDAKTCPYFHQLDALYRRKLQLSGAATAAGGSSSSGIISGQALQSETNPNPPQQETTMPPPAQPTPPPEMENKSGGGGGGGPTMVAQIPTSNGGVSPTFFQEATSGSMMKKPEDIVMELMEQQQHPATTTTTAAAAMEEYDKVDGHDSDNMEEDDDEEEDGKMQYEIQFQRPNVGTTGNGGASSSNATTNTATATTTAATGSFMAMVQ